MHNFRRCELYTWASPITNLPGFSCRSLFTTVHSDKKSKSAAVFKMNIQDAGLNIFLLLCSDANWSDSSNCSIVTVDDDDLTAHLIMDDD